VAQIDYLINRIRMLSA